MLEGLPANETIKEKTRLMQNLVQKLQILWLPNRDYGFDKDEICSSNEIFNIIT